MLQFYNSVLGYFVHQPVQLWSVYLALFISNTVVWSLWYLRSVNRCNGSINPTPSVWEEETEWERRTWDERWSHGLCYYCCIKRKAQSAGSYDSHHNGIKRFYLLIKALIKAFTLVPFVPERFSLLQFLLWHIQDQTTLSRVL